MEHWHMVSKWNGKIFVSVRSESTEYYSIASYLDCGDDIDEIDVETLSGLYRMWREFKEGDKSRGDLRWKYHFYYHEIKIETNKYSGKTEFVDYKTEGKVYRRGKKIFFKAK